MCQILRETTLHVFSERDGLEMGRGVSAKQFQQADFGLKLHHRDRRPVMPPFPRSRARLVGDVGAQNDAPWPGVAARLPRGNRCNASPQLEALEDHSAQRTRRCNA